MKIENNKFVELTEAELFSLYLERGMDDVMDFHEYRNRMKDSGCKIIEGGTQVDAVPVVRCRECKHLGFCGDATNLEVMGFYGYCSRGERKEGAD